ncbi:MAG TPA: hypothetical protein VM689_13225, partial [Aliidongia sp.]|nr:hypothetical protein [Aliidongia sp.]
MRLKHSLAYGALLGAALVGGRASAAENADLTSLLAQQQQQIQQLQQQLQTLQQTVKQEQAQRAAAPVPAAAPAAPVASDAPKVVQTPTNRFYLSTADGQNTIGL